MNVWWFHTQASTCNFNELIKRECIAIGWSEIGDLSRYVRDKEGWERQFKSFVQVKGDIAYPKDANWKKTDRNHDEVPDVFWRLLKVKKGDLVVVLETSSAMNHGQTRISGVARMPCDAISTYVYNDGYACAHTVCANVKWVPWNTMTMGVLNNPASFRTIINDNVQLEAILSGWQKGIDTADAEGK